MNANRQLHSGYGSIAKPFNGKEEGALNSKEASAIIHCPIRYRPAWIKSRVALLLILCGFVVALGPGAIQSLVLDIGSITAQSFVDESSVLYFEMVLSAGVYALFYLLYPVAGLMGDVFCGRWRALVFGMATMSISLLVFGICFIYFRENVNHFLRLPQVLFFVPVLFLMYVGQTAFEANVLQFGVEQLRDAPSREVATLMRWYFWSYDTGLNLMYTSSSIALVCSHSASTASPLLRVSVGVWEVVASLLMALLLVTMLCLRFRHCFRIEPRVANPYRILCAVLSYTQRCSRPYASRRHSWDDAKVSRIDLAKDKYGGPFSSEHVEDVKTFFRMLLLVSMMGVFYFMFTASSRVTTIMFFHLEPSDILPNCSNSTATIPDCSIGNPAIVVMLSELAALISIALVCELIILPLFGIYLPNQLKSIGLGLSTLAFAVAYNLVLDTVGHTLNRSKRLSCVFASGCSQTPLHLSPLFLIVPRLLSSVSYVAILSSGTELIVAQAPHSMQGALIGLFYFTNGLYSLLATLLVVSFGAPRSLKYSYPSCGFGYFLSNAAVAVGCLAVYCLVAKRYKYRNREFTVVPIASSP